MPKQFVSLVGSKSTFQQVLARIAHRELFARAIVITSADFRFVVASNCARATSTPTSCLNRCGATLGPAVAVAATLALERDRQALALVMAADHVIRKPEEFYEALQPRCSSRG